MNANQNLIDMQMERYEIFKIQDPESDEFDVAFDFNGKKLYAHKFMLCYISSTFKSMISGRWTKSAEPIVIQDYIFDDFKEFLTFIYSGQCSLNNDNIFALLDMAEFYAIKVLKMNCEEFLTKMVDLENVNQMLELAEKYSLQNLKECVYDFISKNFVDLKKTESFFHLQKSTVKEIVKRNENTPKQEELFEGILHWADNRAIQKQKGDKNLNLNETIKEELCDILPLIKFQLMNYEFFASFVVRQSFLFSGDQLSDILWARSKVYVKIIDRNGKEMKGQLQCDEIQRVIRFIQSKKNLGCVFVDSGFSFCYWRGQLALPSTSSKVIENENIDWYLGYIAGEALVVVHRNHLDDGCYLLAELFPESGFELDTGCKIEVFFEV